MTHIDVLLAEKGKWKVCVNQVQHGPAYSSIPTANREAQKAKDKFYPQAIVHPAEVPETIKLFEDK